MLPDGKHPLVIEHSNLSNIEFLVHAMDDLPINNVDFPRCYGIQRKSAWLQGISARASNEALYQRRLMRRSAQEKRGDMFFWTF